MRKSWLLLLGIVVSVTCLFAKVVADYDHAVSFGKYRTYSWIGVNVQEPLWNDRVTKAIDNQLTAKGWRKVDSGGDASISAVGATHTEQTIDTFYSGGFGGGWGHRGWIGRTHACRHAPYRYVRFAVKEGNLARRMYRYADGKPGEERKEDGKIRGGRFQEIPAP
jgi:hypothetical protein